jgi:hypothetical protein
MNIEQIAQPERRLGACSVCRTSLAAARLAQALGRHTGVNTVTEFSTLADRIAAAREIHVRLRSIPVSVATLDEKRPLYDSIKTTLDELWLLLNDVSESTTKKTLRSAIRALTVDAEFFAGLQNEAEGYREEGDVTQQYNVLENYLRTHISKDER